MVCDILPSQDASTHLIWNSYLKEYRSFAPDLMPILETRSEVKVTVTRKWNVTIRHFKMHSHTKLPSKMHLHTKFGIPTLKNVRDVLQTRIIKSRSKVNVTVTRIIKPVHEISNNVICATSKASDQPAHTHCLIRAFASRLSIL